MRKLSFCLVVSALFLAGCSPHVTVEVDPTEQQLHKLLKAYGAAEAELQRPPRNREEIESYLEDKNAFVSPGDNEEFVILWGTPSTPQGLEMLRQQSRPPRDPSDVPVLAYERTGNADGRLALYLFGEVKRLTPAEFDKAWFAVKPGS